MSTKRLQVSTTGATGTTPPLNTPKETPPPAEAKQREKGWWWDWIAMALALISMTWVLGDLTGKGFLATVFMSAFAIILIGIIGKIIVKYKKNTLDIKELTPVFNSVIVLAGILFFAQTLISPDISLGRLRVMVFSSQSNQIILEPGRRTIILNEGEMTKEIILLSTDRITDVTVDGKGELMLPGGGTISFHNMERWIGEQKAFYIIASSPLKVIIEVAKRS